MEGRPRSGGDGIGILGNEELPVGPVDQAVQRSLERPNLHLIDVP
jgi:hypothetical protein